MDEDLQAADILLPLATIGALWRTRRGAGWRRGFSMIDVLIDGLFETLGIELLPRFQLDGRQHPFLSCLHCDL
jgi:hypothetical protein